MPVVLKRGMSFEHAKWFTGSYWDGTARPVVCTVTKVTEYAVWYQTEGGGRWSMDLDKFPESVGRWV